MNETSTVPELGMEELETMDAPDIWTVAGIVEGYGVTAAIGSAAIIAGALIT